MSASNFPILLVGATQRTSLEQMYRRAFLALGITQVDLLDVESGQPYLMRKKVVNRLLPSARQTWAGRKLLSHLRNNNSYRFIIIFKGMQFNRLVLEECRKLAPSAVWVNIYPDDPYNLASRAASNTNIIQSLTFYDAFCIWSFSIADRLRESGCKRVIFLPFGYDEAFHVPHTIPNQSRELPVSFIGSWDKHRELTLNQIALHKVDIHGNSWDQAAADFSLRHNLFYKDVFGPEMSSIMTTSSICLNMLRPQNRGSHNMRTFEIPAMGGLMLTNRTQGQQEFFPENEACYMYGNVAELKLKISYILANKAEAERVRARGVALVQPHSYVSRAKFLLQELTSLKP
jgi:spore maturation protein CgeB